MTITKEGALASFYTVNKASIKHLKVYFSPKQAGEGTPSPENVREISGWDGITVYKTGKNLLDPAELITSVKNYYTLNGDLIYVRAAYGLGWGGQLPTGYLKAGQYYATVEKVSGDNSESGGEIRTRYEGMVWSQWGPPTRPTKTLLQDTDYSMRLSGQGNTYRCQIELGSSSTEYEPYRGQTHTIDWTNDIGTVYGGYVDLVTGELVETITHLNMSEYLTNNNIEMVNGTLCRIRTNADKVSPNLCSHFIEHTIKNWGTMTTVSGNTCWCGNGYIGFASSTLGFTTTEEWKTWLMENNVCITAELTVPIRSAPHIETASGNIAHFEADIAAPIKSAKISFNPVQSGEGTPSPTNVRPISGFTNLSLYHSGENLYVPNSNNKGYISKSGVITVDETSTYTDLIPVNLGEVYSFECTTVSVNGDTNRRIHGYNSSGIWVQQLASGTTDANTVEDRKISATIPAGISYIRVSFRNQDTDVRITKENIVTTDWQTTAGTIYGGYIDLVTGKLIMNIRKTFLNDPTQWRAVTKTRLYGYYTPISDRLYGNAYNVICPIAPSALTSWRVQWSSAQSSYLGLYWGDDEPPLTLEELQALASNNQIYIVYACQPVIYQLTPLQLKTFKGTNNIWSNANGPVSISYWTH